MEQSMELVAQKCGQQLNEYQRCILANRRDTDGGEGACQAQRASLSSCASEAVPIVAMVKRRCQTQLQAYHAAVRSANEQTGTGAPTSYDTTDRLTTALKDLYECTERVKQDQTSAS